MPLKSQGLYMLVEDASVEKVKGGNRILTLRLTDRELHGIANGRHTYAAIREALSDETETNGASKAYVRLGIHNTDTIETGDRP